MIAEFELTVLYSQIIVRVSNLPPPVLTWSNENTAQGFSWTPTLVGFGVPDHDGDCLLQINSPPTIAVEHEALWALEVPFDVPSIPISIGAVHLSHDITIEEGNYSLLFQALPGNYIHNKYYSYVIILSFVTNNSADYAILKRGDGISAATVLKRGA